jgi:demethylmenaquinone methyltransferase/2-methoxy-6-polyprenyl-1,4-benzoquinol methylase
MNISQMFNQISKTYDFINRVLSFGQDQRWRRKVARQLPLKPHLEVLDLATGTGSQIQALYEEGLSIHRAVGIDIAEEMLVIGRSKKLAAELIYGDALQIPFEGNTFDATTFSFGIRNVSDPARALREIHRVLKPMGRSLILEFSEPHRWVRPFALFYLRKILPRLGGLLSKHPAAYRYLNESIEAFPSGEAFLSLMREAGFKQVRYIPMNFGSVSLYIGEK